MSKNKVSTKEIEKRAVLALENFFVGSQVVSAEIFQQINSENKFVKWFMSCLNHYDHNKYWRRRECVVNRDIKCSMLRRLYYLYYIKKVDSYWHCTFGTSFLAGSQFSTPPLCGMAPIE